MIVEASGNKEKVEAFIELLRPIGIHEITRTGRIAIGRLSNAEETAGLDDLQEMVFSNPIEGLV